MHWHLKPVVGMLIALPWTALGGQQSACALLTAGDIAAITGARAQTPHNTDQTFSQGPAKGQTMHSCMWAVSDQGMVTVGLMRALTGPAREAGLATIAQVSATLRAQHWTEEKRDFSGGSCAIMTPPPSQHDLPMTAGCRTEVKSMALSVGFMSPTRKLTLDQIKSLLDKAVGRLP
jgi:hypothetical protein